jgi:hypothetical protein
MSHLHDEPVWRKSTRSSDPSIGACVEVAATDRRRAARGSRSRSGCGVRSSQPSRASSTRSNSPHLPYRPDKDPLVGQHGAAGDKNIRSPGRIRSAAGSPAGIPGTARAAAARTHRERTPS